MNGRYNQGEFRDVKLESLQVDGIRCLALYGLVKGNLTFVQNSGANGSMNGKRFNTRVII